MRLSKFKISAIIFLALGGISWAAEFHPVVSASSSTSNDLWAVSNLIQGPGSGFNSAEPHNANGTGSSYAWVTEAPNGIADYFTNGVADPVLVFDLGSNRQLNEISTWGYADTNTNGAKDFTLRFATSTEGLNGFGSSISYTPTFEAAFPTSDRNSHDFSEVVSARYVEMTITDNWESQQGGIGGGDRVGLGEVAFEDSVPDPNPIIDLASGIDFGSHPTDPGISNMTLSVGNLGTDQALEVTSANIQPGTPGAAYFSIAGAPLSVAAGATGDLTITLDAAGNEGCFFAELELETNDPQRPTVTVILVASINCVPATPEEPTFSVDSGTFTADFQLALTTTTPGARIVYTTDGSLPSAINGTTYTGALTIDSSTQVRAATVSGELPPAIATENYVRLAADVAAYSSPLPIMVIENYGAGTIPNKGWSTNTQTGAGLQQLPRQPAYAQIIDRDAVTNMATVTGVPELTSRIGIRVRGAFSSTWTPKPYSLETWKKDADEDRNVKPLDLPEESDWILYYLHPDYDRTMLYNTFIWELSGQTGRYGTGFRFVDVFVNENGGDLTMADRQGVYALAEKVKRGGDRVDFEKLSDDGSTGGWLLGINRMDAIPVEGYPAENGATSPQFFHTAGPNRIQQTASNAAGQGDDIPRQYNAYINFEDPNGYRINTAQRTAIEDWFTEFEDIFYDDDLWLDPVNGYRKYVNTRDFIDYFHLLNLAKQGDGLLISLFPWVSSGERKLHMGPMWDFNNGAYGSTTNSPLYYRQDRLWYPRLFQDPSYQREYVDRWYELRRGSLSDENMDEIIARQSTEITASLAATQGASGWTGRLDTMSANLRNRAAWLDSQFFAPPVISSQPDETITLTNTSGSAGTIFYTLDGSDPEPPDGVSVVETILLDQGATATALIPSTTNGGSTLTLSEWTRNTVPPNEAEWLTGTTGLGYDYPGLIGLDLSAMKDENATAYARIPFNIADQAALDSWDALTLRMKFEDGFVAYINGVKVDEFQAPGAPDWQSSATANHSDTDADDFIDFDISDHLGELQVGTNMLAIHLLNGSTGSSDILALPQLVAAEVEISVPGATVYNGPITLSGSATLRARILSDSGNWSAFNEATYIIGTPADANNVVVSEIMYHPVDPEIDAEFIELQNISATLTVDLTQVAFTAGIDYVFPTGTTLPPGGRVVVSGVDFLNVTRLANGGEQLVLSAADGAVIKDFTYNDKTPWPEAPDGNGFSLVLIDPDSNPDHNDASNWRRSAAVGGSPGSGDAIEFTGDPDADSDSDGIPALLEHLFGSSDSVSGGSPISIQHAADGTLLIEFPHNAGAEDVVFFFESSTDLATWLPEAATLFNVETSPKVSEQWQLAPGDFERRFLRIRAEK